MAQDGWDDGRDRDRRAVRRQRGARACRADRRSHGDEHDAHEQHRADREVQSGRGTARGLAVRDEGEDDHPEGEDARAAGRPQDGVAGRHAAERSRRDPSPEHGPEHGSRGEDDRQQLEGVARTRSLDARKLRGDGQPQRLDPEPGIGMQKADQRAIRCENRGENARDDARQQRDRADRQRRHDAGRPQALDELAGELTRRREPGPPCEDPASADHPAAAQDSPAAARRQPDATALGAAAPAAVQPQLRGRAGRGPRRPATPRRSRWCPA